jgi:drug/metabolite transporter (DMT)-like permease
VIFLRGVFSVLVLLVAVALTGGLRQIVPACQPQVLWRAFYDATSTLFFIAALVHMKIAELSAVVLTSPLILTALAAFTMGDRIGWRRWLAVAVGLLGTLFIVKPSAGNFDVWALVGLISAALSAGRDLATRRIDARVPTLVVGVYGAVAVTLSGAAVTLTTESWIVPSLTHWSYLAIAALFLGLGTYLVVLAFRGVDIPEVAPFRYTLVLWMGLSGFLVFNEVPDRWSLAGAALIALSGLYALHREAVRRRKLSAGSIPPA